MCVCSSECRASGGSQCIRGLLASTYSCFTCFIRIDDWLFNWDRAGWWKIKDVNKIDGGFTCVVPLFRKKTSFFAIRQPTTHLLGVTCVLCPECMGVHNLSKWTVVWFLVALNDICWNKLMHSTYSGGGIIQICCHRVKCTWYLIDTRRQVHAGTQDKNLFNLLHIKTMTICINLLQCESLTWNTLRCLSVPLPY